MREIRPYGSVRGVAGDRYPYRDPQKKSGPPFERPLPTTQHHLRSPVGLTLIVRNRRLRCRQPCDRHTIR